MITWFKKWLLSLMYKPPNTLTEKIDYLLDLEEINVRRIFSIEYWFLYENVKKYISVLEYIDSVDIVNDTLVLDKVNKFKVLPRTFLMFLSEGGYVPDHPEQDIRELIQAYKKVNEKFILHQRLECKLPLSYNLRLMDVEMEHMERIVDIIYNANKRDMTTI